jgi:hypothetical protein
MATMSRRRSGSETGTEAIAADNKKRKENAQSLQLPALVTFEEESQVAAG